MLGIIYYCINSEIKRRKGGWGEHGTKMMPTEEADSERIRNERMDKYLLAGGQIELDRLSSENEETSMLVTSVLGSEIFSPRPFNSLYDKKA